MPEPFPFTAETIAAARQKSIDLGLMIARAGISTARTWITEMEMEQILQAAYAEQEKGDFNIEDMRSMRRSIEWDIDKAQDKLRTVREQLEEVQFAKLELEELVKMKRYVRVVLDSTRKLHKRRQAFVEAWQGLEKWIEERL